MTIDQLKLVLALKDDNFNNIFVDSYQKELNKKNGKSLDFFDLTNLIDKSLNEVKKKDESFDELDSSFVTFKPKPPMNIEKKIKDIEKQLKDNKYLWYGLLGTYSCFEANIILKEADNALKSYEERLEILEKRQINIFYIKKNFLKILSDLIYFKYFFSAYKSIIKIIGFLGF